LLLLEGGRDRDNKRTTNLRGGVETDGVSGKKGRPVFDHIDAFSDEALRRDDDKASMRPENNTTNNLRSHRHNSNTLPSLLLSRETPRRLLMRGRERERYGQREGERRES